MPHCSSLCSLLCELRPSRAANRIVSVLILASASIACAQQPETQAASQATRSQSANATTDPELQRARRLLGGSNWEDASPLVQSYLNTHPDSSDAHALMGLILYRERRPRASMAEYLRASESADLSGFDLRIFALDCAAIPDYPEAEKWLLRALNKDDRDAANWEALAHVRFAAQEYELSIEAAQHVLQLAPGSVSAETLIGLANERLVRPDAAEAAYRTAIQWQQRQKDKDAIPYVGLGRVLLNNNRPTDAIPWLEQAAKIPPPLSEEHELLGLAFFKTARLDEAAVELEQAIDLEPKSARLHLLLARVYRSQSKLDRADAELKTYAALKGTDAQ